MRAGLLLLVVVILVAFGCNEDNYLRLPLNQELVALKPDYSQSKHFVSNENDTIVMRRLSESRYFEKSHTTVGRSGALPEADYVEAERQNLLVGSDNPFLRFRFELAASYSAESPRFSTDRYELSFEDFQGKADAKLEFDYRDSLLCISPRCSYADTLKLLQRTFYQVYFTRRDSLSRKALYVNANRGLVGFRGDNNKIYELID